MSWWWVWSSFCKNCKTITLQNKILSIFSYKQQQISGSKTTKRIFWWNYVCNNYKDDYKRNVQRIYFVIISAKMVMQGNVMWMCSAQVFSGSKVVWCSFAEAANSAPASATTRRKLLLFSATSPRVGLVFETVTRWQTRPLLTIRGVLAYACSLRRDRLQHASSKWRGAENQYINCFIIIWNRTGITPETDLDTVCVVAP